MNGGADVVVVVVVVVVVFDRLEKLMRAYSLTMASH
jgi:hypothetical protein